MAPTVSGVRGGGRIGPIPSLPSVPPSSPPMAFGGQRAGGGRAEGDCSPLFPSLSFLRSASHVGPSQLLVLVLVSFLPSRCSVTACPQGMPNSARRPARYYPPLYPPPFPPPPAAHTQAPSTSAAATASCTRWRPRQAPGGLLCPLPSRPSPLDPPLLLGRRPLYQRQRRPPVRGGSLPFNALRPSLLPLSSPLLLIFRHALHQRQRRPAVRGGCGVRCRRRRRHRQLGLCHQVRPSRNMIILRYIIRQVSGAPLAPSTGCSPPSASIT